MLDTGYLYAKDNKRIFMNTCLGCRASCAYCYLTNSGYHNQLANIEVKTAEQVLEQLEKSNFPVDRNTLITLGCFSECWDELNQPESIKLISHFLQNGNQVQFSTKKEVKIDDVSQLQEFIQYDGQLMIYVSSATISQWKTIEKETENLEKRFQTFHISDELPIPTVLYMKPVLQDITIKDVALYRKVIQKYHIKDVVVGSIFKELQREEKVPFSNQGNLFYYPISDEMLIKNGLRDICRVFSRSSEVATYYKQKALEEQER